MTDVLQLPSETRQPRDKWKSGINDMSSSEPTDNYVELLTTHAKVLERSIEVHTELLTDLMSLRVISYQNKQMINNPNFTLFNKAAALLDVLCNSSRITPEMWNGFLTTLDKFGQQHVVNLLQPPLNPDEDDDRPLSDAEVEQFDACCTNLLGNLTASDDLLNDLIKMNVILRSHGQRIANPGFCDDDRADMLLTIVRTRGIHGFHKFALALEHSQQSHAVEILQNAGVIVRLKLDGIEPQVERKLQADLESRLNAIRRGDFTLKDLDTKLDRLRSVMKNIVSVRRGCLKVAVFCSDLWLTTALIVYADTGGLQSDLQSWLNRTTTQPAVNLVTVKVLCRPVRRLPPILPYEMKELIVLKAAALYDRRRWLRTLLVQPLAPVYERLASVCVVWNDILISRRVRRILRQHFRGLCSPYWRDVEHTYSLETNTGVTGVARLEDRLYVTVDMSDIIRVYDVNSHPPYQPLQPIQAKDLKSPWDMAACCYLCRVYVTDFDTGGIWYVQTRDFGVESMHRRRTYSEVFDRPVPASAQLRNAVTDSQLCRHESPADQGWLVKEVEGPRGISVTSRGNVVVVSWEQLADRSCLLVYDPFNGELVHRIELPDEVACPHHAVEADSAGNFVVCHGLDTSLHRVCVVNYKGQVLRSFGGSRHLSGRTSELLQRLTSQTDDDNDDDSGDNPLVLLDEDIDDEPRLEPRRLASNSEDDDEFHRTLDTPYAVAVDSDGHVFVIDYGGRRVLILDAELTLRRTLLTSKNIDQPRQLWLDRKSGLLYVGQDTGAVDVFDIRPGSKDRQFSDVPASTVMFYSGSISELAGHQSHSV